MAKTYIDGTSCKAINWQFGEFFNMSFNYEKLEQYVNDKGYINITMSKRKEPWQYGDTHYFTLNDWKPEGENNTSNNNQIQNTDTKENNDNTWDISVEDIPF
jgi:hypothetical protein